MTALQNVFNKTNFAVSRNGKGLFFTVLCASFIFSFVSYLIFYPGTPKLFLFESLDIQSDVKSDMQTAGKIYAEKRFIPRNRTKPSLEYFCDELLLGPIGDRYRPLFAPGTKMRTFFKKRGGTVYIDLNEGALFQAGVSSNTKKACYLLEQNIRKNYNSVGNIVITMMGHEIYKYTD